jgi:hypothetical protein
MTEAGQSVIAHQVVTAAQIELYGKFGAPPSDMELERFFFLDDRGTGSWSPSGVTMLRGSGSRFS